MQMGLAYAGIHFEWINVFKLQHLENPADFLCIHVALFYCHVLAIFKKHIAILISSA